MIDPRILPYGTTLAQQNPLAPASLVQQPSQAGGIPQIPTGVVETTHEPSTERKIESTGSRQANEELKGAYDTQIEAKKELKAAAVQEEDFDKQGAEGQSDAAQWRLEELDKLRRQQQESRIQIEEQRRKDLDDFVKTQTTKTAYEDPSPLRKWMSAIAIGFGQYAASINGGVNAAFEIFKHHEENLRREKEAKLKAQVERMTASGQSAANIMKFFEKENDLIEKTFVARNDLALKQTAALKATVPKAASRADEGIALLAQEKAKLVRGYEQNYDTSVRTTGASVQTSSGKTTGGQDFSTKQAVANAQETANTMRNLGELIANNPKAWKEYQDAVKAEQELAASKQGHEKLISSMQGIGLVNTSIDQRLKSKEARQINASMAPLITAKAREMDPIGALNRDAYDNASRSLNIVTSPPNEMRDKAMEYAQRNERLATAYSSPLVQQPAQTGKVGSPRRVSPQAKKQVSSAGSDYDFIVSRINKDPDALDPQRQNAFDEAVELQKKARAQGKNDERALRAMKLIRDELPKD